MLLWMESEREYDISAAYDISYWWFKHKEFYITRHDAPSDCSKVRSYMQILSVISLKNYERYEYTFLKEIILCRPDYKEYMISEANFKNLHPDDFKDLYLLHLQVIEFGDSYQAPPEESGKGSASESSAKKKGRTVAITTEDMQKRRNDVKARTTLLLALLDEHQLKFSKDDLDTMSLDDLYNHLKVYEPKVQKKSESNSQNMAFISSANTSSGKGENNTASTQVSTASADVAAASISHDTVCAYIASQSNGSQIKYKDITQIDEDDIKEMDIKECRAPRSQHRGRRESYKQGSKEEEPAPKALTAIDGIGWDWSYMANKEENHALVANEVATTEFALMAKSSSSSKNEVYDDSFSSKSCRKYTDSLNTKITKLNEVLSNKKVKKEKKGLDSKLTSFESASKDLDTLLGSQRTDKNKEGLGYSIVPPSCSSLLSSQERYVKWIENGAKTDELKKEKEGLDCKLTGFQSASKDLDALLGSQRSEKNKEGLGYSAVPPPSQVYSPPKKDMSWTGLPKFSDDTITNYSRPSPSIERKNWPKNNFAHKKVTPKAILLKTSRTPISVNRPNVNVAQPKRTSFSKSAHSYVRRPFQRKSAVRTQFRVLRVSTVNTKFPTVDSKFSTTKSTFTAGLGNKGKAVKASACWIWRPKQNTSKKGPNYNGILLTFKKYQYIDTQGRLNGCYWHMTGNISYLSEYEPYDGGYVSFGQGGGKITGKDLTFLVAKASTDQSMLWHRRLGHLNFKTTNKLVRNNLVKGLPSKCFENDHTCVACLKRKQHKASCKTKLVNSVSKPLDTLHMDLFGPTSVSSLNHKWYCLVVTDDFSRFTWTFFLKTKDETSGIFRNFITEIENLKDLKVKIIGCDNRGEFENKEMHEFCTRKGIKREFSNARTPQQNRVAERRNRTLIEAARTMLADAKLPVTFWAEAVNTSWKFDAKGDEGYFIGYSMSSKAFRVFNKRTKKVEENLHNYVPVVVAGTSSTNISGTKDAASQGMKKYVSSLRYIALPNWFHKPHMESSNNDAQDACNADAPESSVISNPTAT
nr:hypothetical protein [Tanacetum cinerariifolium]